ncbi:MAG: GH92 family glycosyl hydrolase [Bacteroidota bacterium]
MITTLWFILGAAHLPGYGQEKLLDAVDPFIGTEFFGHTFPGACVPNALVHVSPDVDTQGWTHCAGYEYSKTSIMGFSHMHWSGVGMVQGGEVLFMPTTHQELQIVPGTLEDPDAGYRSRFSHDRESASPGYYSVFLDDSKVKVELTATQRAGFHRYTFPASKTARVLIDVGHEIGDMGDGKISELRILDDYRMEGYKNGGLGKVYFAAQFSKPFLYSGTFDAGYSTPESSGGIFPYKTAERGERVGAFVQYHTRKDEVILVKVGISYSGTQGAWANLRAEIPDWNFDAVRKTAYDTWDKALSKIDIDGARKDQRTVFATALYHSLLAQYIAQDVNGDYLASDGTVKKANGFDFYGAFSCWDTYRTQHPLLTLIAPENVDDYVQSIASRVQNYGWLPAQHFVNIERESMVGDHLVPIIVDAYTKGFRDFDVDLLYRAMRKKAMSLPKAPIPSLMGRSGLPYYLEKGFAPIDKVTEAVPNTLELAYDDWCIANLAKALGKLGDADRFTERAFNYKKVWDPKTRFMRPKKFNGEWLEPLKDNEQEIVTEGEHSYYKYFDPLLVGRRPHRHYTESNAWQYLWSVQHDPQGLIELMGGPGAFNGKLDRFFDMSPTISPPKYVGVVGTIGQYVHGNQPSHHVAYLYNYSGQPWKTQKWAREIMRRFYRTGPGGLCGNEDMGSLSSWYVLSAIGLFPVTPGLPVYAIGSPLFQEASLDLGNGNRFTIRTSKNSDTNKYIQSARLNGKPFNRTWIGHDEILKGGTLHFVMGPKPNKKWGSDPPPSLSSPKSK